MKFLFLQPLLGCTASYGWLVCNLCLVALQVPVGWFVLQLVVGNVNASQTLARATTGASSSPPAPRGLGKHLARCRDN